MFINVDALIFIGICAIIIIGGIYIVNKFDVPGVKRFQLLVSYLGGLSVLLISYNIYINIKSNERVEKNRIAYNTLQNIHQNYLDPQKELLDRYPESFALYASMNQDTDLTQFTPSHVDIAHQKEVETYAALRIFQAMEDFLSTAAYDLTGNYVWINNFLMWMQSSVLQHYWQVLSFNYASDTRELINRIIEKSNDLIKLRKSKGKITSEDYDAISKNFRIQYR